MKSNQFELIKDEMKNQIKSQMNLVPLLKGYVNFFKIILKDFVEYNNIIKTLDNLSLMDFMQFKNTLFNKVNLKIFIHGSITKNNAIILSNNINNLYKNSKPITPKAENYFNQHADLSGYFIYREHLKNSYNINHAVLNFYQIGQETIPNIIMANLIRALCGYIYFTELRIKEQLGYTTKGKVFSEGNVIYYMILIQGSRKTPDIMDLRIENLLIKMRDRIANTDKKKFERMKFSVAKKIGAKDRNIRNRTYRLWNEIILKRFYFNMKKLAKRYVRKVTLNDVLIFFDKMVKKDLKKLSVQEFSNLIKKLPENKPMINNYKASLMKKTDELRKRRKFIKFYNNRKS